MPSACGAPRDEDRLGRNVRAVGDQLNDDVLPRQRRADDARVAVRERPHRVVEVRHRAGTVVERARARPRPSRSCDRARPRCRAARAGRSARPARVSSGASVTVVTAQPEARNEAQEIRVGLAQQRTRMGTGTLTARGTDLRDVRPRCAPPRRCSRRRRADLPQRVAHRVGRARDQRRLVREHAVPGYRLAHLHDRVAASAASSVDTRVAVHLQVDEPRDRKTRARWRRDRPPRSPRRPPRRRPARGRRRRPPLPPRGARASAYATIRRWAARLRSISPAAAPSSPARRAGSVRRSPSRSRAPAPTSPGSRSTQRRTTEREISRARP